MAEEGLAEEKMLLVSTAHCAQYDMNILAKLAEKQAKQAQKAHETKEAFAFEGIPVEVHARGFGYIIRHNMDLDDDEEGYQRIWEALKAAEFSPEFLVLLQFAKDKGYRWVLLDADADKITGLPEGPWEK